MAEKDPIAFWTRVDKSGGCWLWLGKRESRGYGRVSFGGKAWRTHRLAWSLEKGPIPPGLFVLHHCDNPPCVRPEHLFLGTALDNARDCIAKNRNTLGEKHGSAKLTWEKVRCMRKLAQEGWAPVRLSAVFGVGKSQAASVIHGENWKNPVEGEPLAASRRPATALRTHCPRGHEYAGGNLYVRPNGHRHCNTCRRAKDRRRDRSRHATPPLPGAPEEKE